jgi:Nuclease-related domain/UvrD-like helicase C-terminal domain/AAA domain
MALFPQGWSQVEQRCNPGERRVLHQLRRCLGDDFWVWHDVPLGPRARQPDFVVLSPRQGILLLEVKDWKRGTLVGASRDSVELATPRGRVTQAHPLRQARAYAMELVDLMRGDPALVHADGPFAGKLLFPYGWGAVFSHLTAADVAGTDFHTVFPPHQVLLRDDLDEAVEPGAFLNRLWGLFTVHYPHPLTLPQRDRVRWHLFPELRLGAQTALELEPAAALPDLLEVMDLQQEQIARTLGEGHRVIHGAAGSGKTMILIYRAQMLAASARPEQPVLVLCFNRTLADRIDALLRRRGVDERVQVRTFHHWCKDMADSYQLHLPPTPDRDTWYRQLATTVERALETGFIPGGQYSALLIDEAHDFEDDWLRLAVGLVNPATRSLLVLYDDAQSIYRRRRSRFNFAQVGIEARGRTSILKLNYRNTAEVLALALRCARKLLDEPDNADGADDDTLPLVQPSSAGRRGGLPVLLRGRDAREEAALLAERIATTLAAGTPADDVAVLCRTKALMRPLEQALRQRGVPLQSMNALAFRRFDWQRPSVKLLTLHSAKGLEFRQVYLAGLQAMPMEGEAPDEAVRLLYVAMTRATHALVLSAAGEGGFVRRVQVALDEVAARFAAA